MRGFTTLVAAGRVVDGVAQAPCEMLGAGMAK